MPDDKFITYPVHAISYHRDCVYKLKEAPRFNDCLAEWIGASESVDVYY